MTVHICPHCGQPMPREPSDRRPQLRYGSKTADRVMDVLEAAAGAWVPGELLSAQVPGGWIPRTMDALRKAGRAQVACDVLWPEMAPWERWDAVRAYVGKGAHVWMYAWRLAPSPATTTTGD